MGTVYSTQLTNLDAVPQIRQDAGNLSGNLRIAIATIEATIADIDSADIILMCEIPSNAKIHSLMVFNDDLDTHVAPTIAADIGVYAAARFNDTNASKTLYLKDGLIDANCFATAVTCFQDANTEGAEFVFEAQDIANIGQSLYQVAGLASDPRLALRIGFTFSTGAATEAAGTISMRIIYAIN